MDLYVYLSLLELVAYYALAEAKSHLTAYGEVFSDDIQTPLQVCTLLPGQRVLVYAPLLPPCPYSVAQFARLHAYRGNASEAMAQFGMVYSRDETELKYIDECAVLLLHQTNDKYSPPLKSSFFSL